jgi:ABC-2 type transport system permease protein
MNLFLQYAKIFFKGQIVYKKSFILLCIGQFFLPFFVFIGLVLLFERFDAINGWAFSEVALLFGTIHMAFSIAEMLVRGFDSFSLLIRSGDFDRLLVRPVPTALQVMGSRFEFTRIGRLIQGVVVLIIGLVNINLEWTLMKVMALIFMIAGGAFIMAGLFIIFATMSFWTIQGLELANIFTDGGREMSQYPLTIYAKPIQKFFTYVVPFGVVNYMPLMYILDKDPYTSSVYAFIPLLGVLFIVPSLMFWEFGVKHYKSTGS